MLCGDVGGETVGYLVGRFREANDVRRVDLAVLESMFVSTAHRSRGLGAVMVASFLQWALERGASRLMVTTYSANERAIAFYRRNGLDPLSLTLARPVG